LIALASFLHRAAELEVGTFVVGYGIYSVYSGEVLGKLRRYHRSRDPWQFWATVLIAFGIGAAFLVGAVSSRD
jgi:uncharacterized membrane protein